MDEFYQWQGRDLRLRVKVQPRASRDELGDILDHSLKVRIQSAPVDGKANQQLIAFLASIFKVPKNRIELLSGQTSRIKTLLIREPARLPDCIVMPETE